MLLPERKSALVRLSDTVKIGLDTCQLLSEEILAHYEQTKHFWKANEELARAADRGDISFEEAERRIQATMEPSQIAAAQVGVKLQLQLHSQSLSSILMCCFCLESYINSFAWFAVRESDLLGLIGRGRSTSADVLLEAIDRLQVKEKWKTVAKLGGDTGFDTSRYPFQDLVNLFNFRDDHVHDHMVPYGSERAKKRYSGRLPGPISGLLDLNHALYGATVYWDITRELHKLTGVSATEFHRHYNLAPWIDADRRTLFQKTAQRYSAVFPHDSF
jgi:hypothetical protein